MDYSLKKQINLFHRENKYGKLDIKKESRELFLLVHRFGLCNVWMLLRVVVFIDLIQLVSFTIKFLVCFCVKMMISASFWYFLMQKSNRGSILPSSILPSLIFSSLILCLSKSAQGSQMNKTAIIGRIFMQLISSRFKPTQILQYLFK